MIMHSNKSTNMISAYRLIVELRFKVRSRWFLYGLQFMDESEDKQVSAYIKSGQATYLHVYM